MGNNIGGKKKVKVMKIDGETFKLKTPAQVRDVIKDYPGYVLLDSAAVKNFGVRAKPLEPQQELQPKKVYFLVELPKLPEEDDRKVPTRRARSGNIHMSAKDRLEILMLSRRSISDLSMAGPGPGPSNGRYQVKVRLPRAQVAKLVEESKDEGEVAEKIASLCMENASEVEGSDAMSLRNGGLWKPGRIKEREKRVSFSTPV